MTKNTAHRASRLRPVPASLAVATLALSGTALAQDESQKRTRALRILAVGEAPPWAEKIQNGRRMPVVVAVFPVEVKKELSNWPERTQRQRKWMGRKKAAKLVQEPELAQIIRNFDPTLL